MDETALRTISSILFVVLNQKAFESNWSHLLLRLSMKKITTDIVQANRSVSGPLMFLYAVRQAFKAFCIQENYDIIVSYGTIIGISVSFLLRIFRRNTTQFVFDIGISALGRMKFGNVVFKLLVSFLRSIVPCEIIFSFFV